MKTLLVLLTAVACTNSIALPQHAVHMERTKNGEHSFVMFADQKLGDKPLVSSKALESSITVSELNSSSLDLYNIALRSIKDFGHPTRVIGSAGHLGTVEYITNELNKLDYYDVHLQEFTAVFSETRSWSLNYTNGNAVENASAFYMSPPVEPFTGKLVPIENLGCVPEDFENLKVDQDSIALISRGSCAFREKSVLAGKAGFKAAVIYDNNKDVQGFSGSLEVPDPDAISAIGVSYHTGHQLLSMVKKDPDFSLYFAVDSTINEIVTHNVIADTRDGDPNNIVFLGAHSDSVLAGPGINDDGSGVVSLLTTARHLTNFRINNKVRFAFWSAEEEGLLGSTYYTEQLTPEENKKIRLFMDYDMMASPNYEYQIYDGNNSANPAGSEELKNLYVEFYEKLGLGYSFIPFDGRSDYVGFITNGIPGGGIATGAEKINEKNNVAFDTCYHQLCDDMSNLAFDAFLVNTKLIAHSVAKYAESLEGFPPRSNLPELETLSLTAATLPIFPYKGSHLVY